MPRYSVPLLANQPSRLPYSGKVLQFVSLGAAAAVGLKVEGGGDRQAVEDLGNVTAKFKLESAVAFAAFELVSTVDAVVDVLVTQYDITITAGTSVTATIDATQFPLSTREGVASSVVDNAAVAVGAGGAALLAANSLRKAARFFNIGPDPVAIGTTGQTWAKRAIVLNMGDGWSEEAGANVAWTAITNTATAASVTAQEVLS